MQISGICWLRLHLPTHGSWNEECSVIKCVLLCSANCLILVQIYKELEKMQPWRRRNGTDFVFFFPWSIAHVLDYEHSRPDGGVLQAYLDIVCNQLQRGIHITVENLQVDCYAKCFDKPEGLP